MIIREYKMRNQSFNCTELECEKTGIKLQKIDMIHFPNKTEYRLVDTDEMGYTILESIFEVIKKLIV